MISVEDVKFGYSPSKPLLRGVNLQVRSGEVHALLGPNGAGKSTLLKVMSGDLKPSSGKITMCGKALESIGLNDRARMRAVMPQHADADFPFTVLEVVSLGRTPYSNGRIGEREVELAYQALEHVEALDLVRRRYSELSGGERQRINLARALVQVLTDDDERERFLLLDEPTASFDLIRQQTLMLLLRKPVFRKLGVFIIMHDVNLAARFADRITVLYENGYVAASGAPWDIITGSLIFDAFKVDARVQAHPEADCPLVII